MPALNFKSQFVEPIRARTKQHTIRADRKDGKAPKVGEKYALYCGMRTKNCFRILPELVTVTQVQRIHIVDGGTVGPRLIVDGEPLTRDESELLARADGFADWSSMKAFWDGRIPFAGNIIHWGDR